MNLDDMVEEIQQAQSQTFYQFQQNLNIKESLRLFKSE